jgi:hypothetical protein
MGLDMYAYTASKAEADWDSHREIAYWRKHPNLHGWMKQLWESRGNAGMFNGNEIELTWEDLDRLEQTVKQKALPSTQGFFFGDDSAVYYHDKDLEFIKNARADLFLGLKVFYNSSW